MAYNVVVAFLSWQLILPHLTVVQASTHWVVTEDGRIQAQMDSVFNLQRPYDLMALLKQEERAEMLEDLKQELLSRKGDIDGSEDRDSGMEQRFYRSDPDCIAAGRPLVEFELYQSTVLPLEDKDVRTEDFLDFIDIITPPYISPQCADYVDLEFSIHAFEHLEGVKERGNLSMLPELGLKTALPYVENVEEFGHRVHVALLRNNTSWVLHNMAAFYWRMKGEARHAIECLRRALHYSPRQQKDVALVSLSNILHQVHYSNEAAIVIHAAIDISRELNVNYFMLGNIYAVLAEYNKSVVCFENALRIQPDFEAASKRRHAVLCHAKLEAVLETQHRSLQRTLAELRDYQQKHDSWKQQQQKLALEQASRPEKIEQTVSYETHKMRLANEGVGEHCEFEEHDGNHMLQCAWARVKRVLTDYDFTLMPQKEQVAAASVKTEATDYMKPVRPALYTEKRTVPTEGPNQPQFMTSSWPSKEECDEHAKKFPMGNEFPTTYLPPENKGFEVHPLLGSAQGLALRQQHPFPWYPPVCTSLSDIPEGQRSGDHLKAVKNRNKLPLKIPDTKMKQALLSSVDGWEESSITQDEIGQRIVTALKKKIGPSWVLYNLAALYWRVVGHGPNAVECVRRALHFVPDQYRDVPLLNLANILYRSGHVHDAISVVSEALSVNDVEPEIHFFMGSLLAANSNLVGSIRHYQQALIQNPEHADAYSSLRIIACYQKFHPTTGRAAESASSTQSLQPTCSKPVTKPREAVFICTKNAGVESCFLDHKTECTQTGEGRVVSPSSGQLLQFCAKSAMHAPGAVKLCQANAVSARNKVDGPLSDTLGDMSSDPEHLRTSVEDITEYYRQQGICSGQDCVRFMQQVKTFDSISYGNVKDTSGSSRCSRGEPSTLCGSGSDDEISVLTTDASAVPSAADDPKITDETSIGGLPVSVENHLVPHVADPLQHRSQQTVVHMPPHRLCQRIQTPIDFRLPVTVVISVATKVDNLDGHVDFTLSESSLPDALPICDVPSAISRGFPQLEDHWPTMVTNLKDTHRAETDLMGVVEDFDGLLADHEKRSAVAVIGRRIAYSLRQNSTSWILNNLASLYWRVQGRSDLAVDCVLAAYYLAPVNAKDVALLGLASMLYRCGMVDEAMLVTVMALDNSPDVVAIHFMLANLYAAKGQFRRAALFFESTLGLQTTFEPAAIRLINIYCLQLLPKLESESEPAKSDEASPASEAASTTNA